MTTDPDTLQGKMQLMEGTNRPWYLAHCMICYQRKQEIIRLVSRTGTIFQLCAGCTIKALMLLEGDAS